MKIFYTVAAEADLRAIGVYTLEAWGQEQHDAYLAILEAGCEDIIPRHLKLARPVSDYPLLRSWRVEHHFVYFRRVRGGIEIVRVLHDRQLPAKHMKR
jgi:toxin ParE1/3/4